MAKSSSPKISHDEIKHIFEFYRLIHRISRHIEIYREDLAKNLDITGAQLYILSNIYLQHKCTYTELAKISGLAKNTVSITVKPLFVRHLIEKLPEPTDGRISFLTVSTKGKMLLDDCFEKVVASYEKKKLVALNEALGEDSNIITQLKNISQRLE